MKRPFKEYRPFGPLVENIELNQMVTTRKPVMEQLDIDNPTTRRVDSTNIDDKYKERTKMVYEP